MRLITGLGERVDQRGKVEQESWHKIIGVDDGKDIAIPSNESKMAPH